MTVDTLAYVKELEAGGVDRATAETVVTAFAKIALPVLATKADLERLETKLVIKLGGIVVTVAGLLAVVQHVWK